MGTEVERRWVVEPPPDPAHPLLAAAVAVEIEQVYLRDDPDAPAGSRRVRAVRGADGTARYTSTVKTGTGAVREEVEEDLTAARYTELRDREADPDRSPVRKTRHRFRWSGRLWELDEVREPVRTWLLECELPNEAALAQELPLPPPCRHAREVTGDPGWSNAELARGALPGS